MNDQERRDIEQAAYEAAEAIAKALDDAVQGRARRVTEREDAQGPGRFAFVHMGEGILLRCDTRTGECRQFDAESRRWAPWAPPAGEDLSAAARRREAPVQLNPRKAILEQTLAAARRRLLEELGVALDRISASSKPGHARQCLADARRLHRELSELEPGLNFKDFLDAAAKALHKHGLLLGKLDSKLKRIWDLLADDHPHLAPVRECVNEAIRMVRREMSDLNLHPWDSQVPESEEKMRTHGAENGGAD